jgi:S-ribosylhomocysteine lyase
MGCQTGFYLLVRDASDGEVLDEVILTLEKIISHDGEMFGATRVECGNYLNLDICAAKAECERYLKALKSAKTHFVYPEE